MAFAWLDGSGVVDALMLGFCGWVSWCACGGFGFIGWWCGTGVFAADCCSGGLIVLLVLVWWFGLWACGSAGYCHAVFCGRAMMLEFTGGGWVVGVVVA